MKGKSLKYKIMAAVGIIILAAAISYAYAYAGGTGKVTEYKVKVLESIRHDLASYTQGLFIVDGVMYESSGQYGQSSFRKVELSSGKVLQNIPFPEEYFLEGSCELNGVVYILTWFEETCFVYDLYSMEQISELPYEGQGWGLTTDGTSLIMSDGTSVLTYRDPMTFAVQKTVKVTLDGKSVSSVNELEYINGEIWANIYGSNWIYRIDPHSGRVTGKVNCAGLLEQKYRSSAVDVLNGIAVDPADGSVYLTGKYWPRMYKVVLEAL